MSEATFPLKLLASVKAAATRLAEEDGVSLNQWIASAVAQKVGSVETESEFSRRRAGNAQVEDLRAILALVPDRAPDPGGELPPGVQDQCNSLEQSMTEAEEEDWDSPEAAARRKAHARALREQARAGGLRFEVYLPSGLADWLLGHIERGTFRDPSEAVFVMLGEQEELEAHPDLREELLRRGIQAASDDPRPGIPAEEVEAYFEKLREEPRPEPAVWRKEARKRA